jgi:hypothetical protein
MGSAKYRVCKTGSKFNIFNRVLNENLKIIRITLAYFSQ